MVKFVVCNIFIRFCATILFGKLANRELIFSWFELIGPYEKDWYE